jgi:Flp pilus assembly protein TadD
MLAYAAYAAAPSLARYALVAAALAAGLMAKPMVVTLPFVLLLLDGWPLRRTDSVPVSRLVVEKLPLLALSLASAIITFIVQRGAGAVRPLETLPVARRIASAAIGYWEYVWKTVWPTDLALLYPHAPSISWVAAGAAIVGLVIATVLAVRSARTLPWLLVGWLWFLGTLVPVIGLVQVGSQRIADRYTYIPTIGLFIIAVWGGAALAKRARLNGRIVAAATLAVLLVHGALAHAQVRRWRSSIAIWEHTVLVTTDNARAHNHLGHAYASAGRDADARREFETALRLNPGSPEALHNLGALLARHDEHEQAIAAFRRAAELAPALPHVHGNLGLALLHAGHPEEAVAYLDRAIEREPTDAELHRRLGVALALTGRAARAVEALETSVRLDPGDAVTHNALGAAYGNHGRPADAIRAYREAVRLDPRLFEARANLGRTLLEAGRDEGKQVLHALAVDLLRDGQLEPALQQLEVILRRDPSYAPSRQLLEDLAAQRRARHDAR